MENNSRKVFTCPMHPEIQKDMPGICPECGMNLVPTRNHKKHKNAGLDKHAGHSTQEFLKKFWVSLVLTIPVLIYSDVFETIAGITARGFAGSKYIPLILGSIVFFYGGRVFLAGAWRELKARLPGMMTLIGVAVLAAYLWSIYAVFAGEEALFWELTTLITIMLLGHWFEMRAVSGAQSALKELSKLLPETAEVLRNGETFIIPLGELKEGDLVLVKPGARIPSDGMVIEGQSDINESMVTGESKPVSKKINDQVIAGTINSEGFLKVKVTKIGERTFLAGVMRLVAEAQVSKSRLQVLSDRAAFYLTIIAIFSAAITLLAWLFKADPSFAVSRMVAVLVIACPHALGLAVPLVASISTTLAAKNGFLVRQRLALESARNIDIVLFDKTGTLTKGEYGVTDIWVIKAKDEEEVLRYAASIDSFSEHFAAKATVQKAKELGLNLFEVEDFTRISGKGVKGKINGLEVYCGGLAVLDEAGVSLPDKLKEKLEEAGRQGKTLNFAIKDKELLGVMAFADLIRDESREAVRRLKSAGIKTAMITGDSEEAAGWVSKELGIDEYFARVLPHQKSEKVKLLQQKGQKVAMVGDGINDAPALTQADLGIAIGAGTNVAIESAGIILVKNDPRDIVKIIKLSRLTYIKMIQNLFWATGYNVVALPLAAGVAYSRGIVLEPALAAIFMSLSTVIVAVNAILLKRKSL